MNTPRAELHAAAEAVSTAVRILKIQQSTFEAFLKECGDMENFGHIVDPTLYKNPERRAVSALMEPLFKSAMEFIAGYEAQIAQAKSALAKVSA